MYNLFKPNDVKHNPFDDDLKEREMMAESLNFYERVYSSIFTSQQSRPTSQQSRIYSKQRETNKQIKVLYGRRK